MTRWSHWGWKGYIFISDHAQSFFVNIYFTLAKQPEDHKSAHVRSHSPRLGFSVSPRLRFNEGFRLGLPIPTCYLIVHWLDLNISLSHSGTRCLKKTTNQRRPLSWRLTANVTHSSSREPLPNNPMVPISVSWRSRRKRWTSLDCTCAPPPTASDSRTSVHLWPYFLVREEIKNSRPQMNNEDFHVHWHDIGMISFIMCHTVTWRFQNLVPN